LEFSRTTGNVIKKDNYYAPFFVESLVENGDYEDFTNVQIALDNINNDILQIQTDISNIQPEEITKFIDFKDSSNITYQKGIKVMKQKSEGILQQQIEIVDLKE
jgi:GTP:adenosylcobinamide-phosphate guanylyltransferase